MATIAITDARFRIDLGNIDLSAFAAGTVDVSTSSSYQIHLPVVFNPIVDPNDFSNQDPIYRDYFITPITAYSGQFSYVSNGALDTTKGVVTEIDLGYGESRTYVKISGLSLSVAALTNFIARNDGAGLAASLLSGDDTAQLAANGSTFDGGPGFNTVVYPGARSQYSLGANAGGLSVTGASGTDQLRNVGDLQFADKAVFVATQDQANVARLYSALNRAPEAAGLAVWETLYANIPTSAKALGAFVALAETSGGYNGSQSIAAGFTGSTEFQRDYGSVDNPTFVGLMYNSVLGRAPIQSETAAWVSLMTTGDSTGQVYTREMVLVGIAESPENVIRTGHDWLFAI